MRIEREAVLRALAADPIGAYRACAELVRAGDGGWIESADCFAAGGDPSAGLVTLTFCRGAVLQIRACGADEALLEESLCGLDGRLDRFAELELWADSRAAAETAAITRRFRILPPDYPDNPDYVMHAPTALREAEGRDPVGRVLRMDADAREALCAAAEAGRLDRDGLSPDRFAPLTEARTVWYWLCADGEPAAYLRAACRLAPVWEIGWLYTERKYRGRGCAAALVRHFTRSVYAQGGVPRYGYAVSPASAAVAEACGYTPVFPDAFRCALRPRG